MNDINKVNGINSMKETISPENVEKLIEFVMLGLDNDFFDKKLTYHINLACEEALVNVLNYAYPEKYGDVEIFYKISTEPKNRHILIRILDEGIPFDPLSLPEPDLNIPIEMRVSGGLGVFIIKEVMDEVKYERHNGKNILTLIKNF